MERAKKKQTLAEEIEKAKEKVSKAFTIFAKAVVREKHIPFEIYAATDDFYNEYNQNCIKKAVAGIKAGKGTAHELIEVSDE